MLGVLKRRWKPKRTSNGNRLSNDSINGGSVTSDVDPIAGKPARTTPTSVRQVHPLCEDKAQLLAYENVKSKPNRDSNPPTSPPTTVYPLIPNICVEGGRIEFIKTSPDADGCQQNTTFSIPLPAPPPVSSLPPLPTDVPTPPQSPRRRSSMPRRTVITPDTIRTFPTTVTRSQQTVDFFDDEKYDIAKEYLEQRVAELEMILEREQKSSQKDKLAIAKLQRQLARRESVHRDAERERRLRAESECRLREAGAEVTRYRARLKLLTQEFAKMEESVRTMLVYKSRTEQLKQEKVSLTLAFEARSQQYQDTIARLSQEISALRQQLDTVSTSSTTGSKSNNSQTLSTSSSCAVAALEANNASLHREVEEARRQYERCLDDVANQVVRALLSQKTLREEITSLTRRIRELETQNRALTSLLVQQLRTGSTPSSAMITPNSAREQLALDGIDGSSVQDVSPLSMFSTSPGVNASTSHVKHSNSFNFDSKKCIDKRFSTGDLISSYNERVLPNGDLVACISEKRLSANVLDMHEDAGLSLEDKKRHQVLAELWADLRNAEVTPQKLLNALSALEPTLWTGVPPKRPATLDLALPNTLPMQQQNNHQQQPQSTNIKNLTNCKRTRPVIAVNKSEDEPGSESPESGNRDEGYSTMSSDVQCDVNRSQSEPTNRGLEDLAEATDETADTQSENRYIIVEDRTDPDILYIPINLALRLNPRNSYPPSKDLLPFQHVMRSFSDSHLCIKITTAPSPCYSISSPITSTPSVVLLDVNPLRRTRGNSSLAPLGNDSWGSNLDLEPMGPNWDSEYIQHWLKLDETRSNLQQQHRDLLELEYDRAELEDWSLSLSTEDIREAQNDLAQTPGQISIATLPSIQEGSAIELEEDSNECLWNDSSYLADRAGGELVALLMDNERSCEMEKSWPYAPNPETNSPPESWSSISEDDPCSKRSSAAMSGCSDDAPVIGTDFTRDFYRLVKFESTKSLASCSSRGAAPQPEMTDREQTLQSVLNFIAEQQLYCQNQEHRDSRPTSARDFCIEAPPQTRLDETWPDSCASTEAPISDCGSCDNSLNTQALDDSFVAKHDSFSDNENYVTFKHLQTELALNEQNTLKDLEEISDKDLIAVSEILLPSTTQSDSKLSKSCGKVSLEIHTLDKQNNSVNGKNQACDVSVVDESRTLVTVLEEEESSPPTTLTESFTSSVSTPDTIVSRIPRRQKSTSPKSNIPVSQSPKKSLSTSPAPKSPAKTSETNGAPNKFVGKSRIPYKHKSSVVQLVKKEAEKISQPVITSERLPQFASSGIAPCSVIEGSPDKAISFHERATSKDVIDELNRMIRKGDESATESEDKNLDNYCYPTGWVHVERDIDFNDPKARANLLDVMLASSDSSPTSSCGGSVSSESNDDHSAYRHLHKLHRYRRQKKASAVRPHIGGILVASGTQRPSIIGRDDFFVRYGEKEREAVASFDFLQEYSSTSSSLSSTSTNTMEI